MKETARRVVRFGVQNYLRNGWLSIAATLMVAMTLFIVSIFALQAYMIKSTTQTIQDKLDMAIYITDSPSEEAVVAFVDDIKAYPEVREVTYLDKTQVVEEWNKLNVDQKIKNQVNTENNPLPRTIKLKAHNPESLDVIAEKITASKFTEEKYIRNISYRNNRPIIQQLVAQSNKVTKNGIIVGAIFTLIAVVFIYNTIKIIIRFRNDEIAIMKLVGATDSFVRGPFIIEGALYGLVAGIITLVALYFYLQNGLSESISAIGNPDTHMAQNVFHVFQANILAIAGTLIASAVLLSVSCSWLSVRHHLKR
jgi:cell division transport system permease protein